MSWLCDYFKKRGKSVTGSDIVTGGHNAQNVQGADLVVYNSAIADDNVELVEARKLGIKTISRAKLLGKVSEKFDKVIAVSGAHGKTTVTGMIASVMKKCGVHVGGKIVGEHVRVDGDSLVCEACEYKENFLHLKRDIAVVLNVSYDHPDYYANYNEVLKAFCKFASGGDIVITSPSLADYFSPKKRIATVGEGGDCFVLNYKNNNIVELSLWGRKLVFHTNLIGYHNAENFAFAATALALSGYNDDEIASGLSSFKGVERRLQRIGRVGRAELIDDYAHHPEEIVASSNALAGDEKHKLLVVYQPHTYSRLNELFEQFVTALSVYDCVVLPVFGARETAKGKGSGALAEAINMSGGHAVCVSGFDEASKHIKSVAKKYKYIVIMSAGDTWKLNTKLLDKIRK